MPHLVEPCARFLRLGWETLAVAGGILATYGLVIGRALRGTKPRR